MNSLVLIAGVLLLIQLAAPLPTQELTPLVDDELFQSEAEEAFVRDKRDHLEEQSVEPTDLKIDPAAETKATNPESLERFKKQAACVKVGCCGKSCDPLLAADATGVMPQTDKIIVIPNADAMEGGQIRMVPPAARTIDPLYAYGAPTGPQSQQTGFQFHAVLPYALHQPVHRPSSYQGYNYNTYRQPHVVYYNNPEPVYLPAHEHSYYHHQPESVPMYCHPLKSHDEPEPEQLDKQLPANATSDDQMQAHIERVNQIKDEISQLNQAAQRIVDQQDQIARMHQEHMMGRSSGYMPMRSNEPFMRYHVYVMMPYYNRSPQGKASEGLPSKDEGVTSSETIMREVYPPHPDYYYYPSSRSETGFNVPPMFSRSHSNALNYPASQEDMQLFMKFLDMTKRMGTEATAMKANAAETKHNIVITS